MRLKKHIVILPLLAALMVVGVDCSTDSADSVESGRVEAQQNIYVDSQPVPTFDWSLERHIAIELYEARNNAVQTYSYVRNLNGQVYFECESIGFPIPANTQLTNPERSTDVEENGFSTEGLVTLPQPEPNGLFTSPSNVGTYVFCLNEDGTVSPSYFEDKVETHLTPLDGSEEPALKIKIQQ